MKAVQLVGMVLVVLLLMAAPAAAADGDSRIGGSFGAGLGAGITIIGAGWGFGRIGAAALESMARQPEVAGRVQTGMIVIAALLEGATFFALIVCIVAIPTAG
ncbi:MAG: ATP synthase F0 subunit C [Gemmataceae bacterium]